HALRSAHRPFRVGTGVAWDRRRHSLRRQRSAARWRGDSAAATAEAMRWLRNGWAMSVAEAGPNLAPTRWSGVARDLHGQRLRPNMSRESMINQLRRLLTMMVAAVALAPREAIAQRRAQTA